MGTANLVKSRLTLEIGGRIRPFFNPVNFNWLIGNNPVNLSSAAAANLYQHSASAPWLKESFARTTPSTNKQPKKAGRY